MDMHKTRHCSMTHLYPKTVHEQNEVMEMFRAKLREVFAKLPRLTKFAATQPSPVCKPNLNWRCRIGSGITRQSLRKFTSTMLGKRT
jgi:hypothetical protein